MTEMSSTDVNAWNQQVVTEFRANEGQVGGDFAGAPMLLLHTHGAKSGVERVNPVMYQQVGEDIAVFASKAGAPSHPDWYFNLLAHPEVEVEIGGETIKMRARVAEGAERDRIWATQKESFPGFAEYEAKTARVIPVVILERVTA